MNKIYKTDDFYNKRKNIKKILDTPEYQKYIIEKKKNQNRKENIYKITSIGNSTNVVKYLIIINILIYIISYSFSLNLTFNHFSLYNFNDSNFRLWQIITSIFLHGGFLHLLLNMIALWSIANNLNNFLNELKILQIYIVGGVVGSLLHATLISIPAVGASGAICALLSTLSFFIGDSKINLFFIIPIKLKTFVFWFTILSIIFGGLSIIDSDLGFGIAHFGHLGGLITGYFITYIWKQKINYKS